MGITFENNGNNSGQKKNKSLVLMIGWSVQNKVSWTAFVPPVEIKLSA
jgi:hypothetical protein